MKQLLQQPNASPELLATIGKEASSYEELVQVYKDWNDTKVNLSSLKSMIVGERDPTMTDLLREEITSEEGKIEALEAQLRFLLIAPDKNDMGDAIMEIRAGTGGDEAALFAGEILAMYERYCLSQKWNFNIKNRSDNVNGEGGIKEASVSISGGKGGGGVFGRLKFESGVHRVQRVPKTESQGRVHTSTITIAILPQAEDIIVDIPERDLRIDSFKSSGPGGQHVNKTNSAVRVVHLPTGLSVAVQEERCAQQNRIRALNILRTRLYEMKRAEQGAVRRSSRQSQIGQAERSEKIRTFNFPQGRITDHRINFSIHDLDSFFSGRELDQFLDQLAIQAEEQRLASLDLLVEKG